MLTGFKNFLMRDDVVTVAVGLVVALAFSNLVKAFTDSVINPLVAAAQPGHGLGLGVQLNSGCDSTEACQTTFLDLGSFISAIVYFAIFMAVVYFLIVIPYKHIQARRGITVFGDAAATRTCQECLSDDLPEEARKCKHCGSLQIASA